MDTDGFAIRLIRGSARTYERGGHEFGDVVATPELPFPLPAPSIRLP